MEIQTRNCASKIRRTPQTNSSDWHVPQKTGRDAEIGECERTKQRRVSIVQQKNRLDSCLVRATCEGGEGLRRGFATFQDLGLHFTISFCLEGHRIINEDKLKRNDSLLTL
jgi:hypothetical protein